MAELAKELGIPAGSLGMIREKHLTSDDWYRLSKRGRPVMLTEEGESKLRIYAECHNSEPQVVPTFKTVQFWGVCPNRERVYARMDFGPEEGWRRIEVIVPRRLHDRLRTTKKGKVEFKVEVIRGAAKTLYRHESLASGY